MFASSVLTGAASDLRHTATIPPARVFGVISGPSPFIQYETYRVKGLFPLACDIFQYRSGQKNHIVSVIRKPCQEESKGFEPLGLRRDHRLSKPTQ